MASRLYPLFSGEILSIYKKNSSLYVDIPGFVSPCALTGDSLRPDLLLAIPDKCLRQLVSRQI